MRSKHVTEFLRVWKSFEDGWMHAIYDDGEVLVRWDAPVLSQWHETLAAARDGEPWAITLVEAVMRDEGAQALREVA